MKLMSSYHSDDEENEISDFKINDIPSYDELQNAFHELHEDYLNHFRKCSKQKKIVLSLESKVNDMKMKLYQVKNPICNTYQSLESKIIELNQVIKKYEKSQIGLDNMLRRQIYLNDKCGLGFSKFYKPITSKIIFVKDTSNKFNNVELKKMHGVIHPKSSYVRNNSYVYKRNHVFRLTLFYCNTKGHTPNACYIRNYDILYGEYVWVRNETNPRGHK